MRTSSVSFDGKVSLIFTNEMILPSNFTDILNLRDKTEVLTVISNKEDPSLDNEARKQELLNLVILAQTANNKTTIKPDLLQLVMIRPEPGETQRGNMTSWSVINSTSEEI